MNKIRLLLIVVLVLGFIFRLYRFDNPIADWHSWRQSETSSVSRNFANNGFDLLHPRMDNISNVQSGIDNPEGYFFTEFPLYNAAQAGLFKLFGVLTLEQWGRIISIISSTFISLFLYLIVSRHSNKAIGLLAAGFYSFTPFNIYFGRTILADTTMVAATLGGIYFFDLAIKKNFQFSGIVNFQFFLAIVFTASAFLLKPYALFFVLPMVYLAFKKFGLGVFKKWQLWLFGFITLVPLIWWRTWMTQFPEGIPANTWLLNGNGIRFRPAFFRWIFYERLTILISGYFGVIVALFGLYKLKQLKEWMFFSSFFLSSLLYVFVFATGNVQHDYYQIPIMPSVAIIFAIGSYFLYTWSFKKIPLGKILLIICIVLGFYFASNKVKDYFNINNRSIIVAGKAVDLLTPKDAKIIANYTGDTSFLYQTNRRGWASFQDPLPQMIAKGASFLVLVNPTQEDHVFARDYKIVSETKEYIIFDLLKKP
jgi:4-amino-4-deoxy-L-arabinose transferase-like glycosyltransferase